MTLTIYNYTGDNRVIDKTGLLGTGVSFSAASVTPTNVVNPVVRCAGNPTGGNYAYIDSYGFYYWITDIKNVVNGVCEISLKRDPLTSFRSGIKASPCVAARATDSHINADYPDGKYKILQFQRIGTTNLGGIGSGDSIIFGFVK